MIVLLTLILFPAIFAWDKSHATVIYRCDGPRNNKSVVDCMLHGHINVQ